MPEALAGNIWALWMPGGGAFRTTMGLIQEFGRERVLDTPISEAAFVGTAIGAASTGLRPVAELMFVDFIGVCMDQLLNNAAKMRYMFGGQVKVPLTLLTRVGAGFGGAAQHSESFYSIFSHIPGLKGVVPSDPFTAKGLLVAALRDDDPVVYFEHKGLYGNTGPVPEEPYTFPLGKARTVRGGYGRHPSRHLAHDLGLHRSGGRSWLNPGSVARSSTCSASRPSTTTTSSSQLSVPIGWWWWTKTRPFAASPRKSAAGFRRRAFDYLDAPPSRVTAPHTPVPYNRQLEAAYIPNTARVVKTVRRLMGRG